MCLIEEFTDVYPMETRIRKVVHRCLFSERLRTCKFARVYDRGKFYHVRYTPERMSSPRIQIIKPREEESDYPLRRKSSQPQDHPFEFHRPSPRRTYEPHDGQRTNEPRRSEKSPRPFVVKVPKDTDARRSASPRIHIISPRNKAPSRPENMVKAEVFEVSPRTARARQRSWGKRLPRERTPSVDREPSRRREQQRAPRIVEIHRDSSSGLDEERQRQVRFASDIEYEKNTNSKRARNRERLGKREYVDAQAPTHRRNSFAGNVPRLFRNDSSQTHGPQERNPRVRVHSPYPGTPRETRRGRTRVRMVHTGNREASEGSDRFRVDVRRKPRRNVKLDINWASPKKRRSRPFRLFALG